MKTPHISLDEVQIERLDDIPLLIGLQQQLGLDAIIDDVIPRHWRHQGLSPRSTGCRLERPHSVRSRPPQDSC